jgi:CheY-like chemotaxis protein
MTRLPLDGSTDEPIASVEPTTAPENAATSVETSAEIAAATAVQTSNEQVVCPRCNLHFHPHGRRQSQGGPRKTILVVDDLAYFRQIAKDALESTFNVLTVATRAEAGEILRRQQVDLLVLDLTLDGCDAGREFLSELTPKPCPILIFTAQDESEMYGENWEELKRLGADDLVIKGMQVAESLVRKSSALLGIPVDDEEPIG